MTTKTSCASTQPSHNLSMRAGVLAVFTLAFGLAAWLCYPGIGTPPDISPGNSLALDTDLFYQDLFRIIHALGLAPYTVIVIQNILSISILSFICDAFLSLGLPKKALWVLILVLALSPVIAAYANCYDSASLAQMIPIYGIALCFKTLFRKHHHGFNCSWKRVLWICCIWSAICIVNAFNIAFIIVIAFFYKAFKVFCWPRMCVTVGLFCIITATYSTYIFRHTPAGELKARFAIPIINGVGSLATDHWFDSKDPYMATVDAIIPYALYQSQWQPYNIEYYKDYLRQSSEHTPQTWRDVSNFWELYAKGFRRRTDAVLGARTRTFIAALGATNAPGRVFYLNQERIGLSEDTPLSTTQNKPHWLSYLKSRYFPSHPEAIVWTSIFQFFIIILGISILSYNITASVCTAVLVRAFVLLLFAPESNFGCSLDLYLWGLLVPFCWWLERMHCMKSHKQTAG